MRVGLLIGGLFLALLVATVTVIEQVRIPDMFEVDGNAQIAYAPDTAALTVEVSAQADVSNDAAQKVAVTMAGVMTALKNAGVADADVTSLGVSSAPTPQYNNGTNPPAFTAQQSIKVVVHRLDRLGALTTIASAAGANNWSVDYSIADQGKAQAAARRAALQNAIDVADVYAAQGGFKRGRVLKLLESDVSFPYADYPNRNFVMSAGIGRRFASPAPMVGIDAAAALPVPTNFVIPKPEPQTVSASVHVLFELR